MTVDARPPVVSASSTRSKARAEIRTPAPNAITEATTLGGTLVNQATAAPTTRAPPASRPQNPASAQMGIDTPSHGGSPILPRVAGRIGPAVGAPLVPARRSGEAPRGRS